LLQGLDKYKMADPVDGGELESPVESREVGASLDGGE
jgi:hypothetical protein